MENGKTLSAISESVIYDIQDSLSDFLWQLIPGSDDSS